MISAAHFRIGKKLSIDLGNKNNEAFLVEETGQLGYLSYDKLVAVYCAESGLFLLNKTIFNSSTTYRGLYMFLDYVKATGQLNRRKLQELIENSTIKLTEM